MLQQIYSLTFSCKWTCTLAKLFLLTKIQLFRFSFAPKGNSKLCFLSCSWGFLQHEKSAEVQTVQSASALGNKHCVMTQNKSELPRTVLLQLTAGLDKWGGLCLCTTLYNSLYVDCIKEVSSDEEHRLRLRTQMLLLMPDIALQKAFNSCCFHPLAHLLCPFAVNPVLFSKQAEWPSTTYWKWAERKILKLKCLQN